MRTLVVIPTYNERENLPRVVSTLLEHEGVGVLVVDDGSPDGTGQLADDLAASSQGRVTVMHRTGPRGLGRSYVDGLTWAVSRDVSFVCQMDADLSHNPADVPRLVAAAEHADVVIGSRYVEGGRIENWPVRRQILSRYANIYIRTITGVRTRDNTSGFRCWRRDALARLPLQQILSDGYAFLVELIWEARRAGCRIEEIPITFVERRAGASKLSWRVLLESVALPWRLALRRQTSNL